MQQLHSPAATEPADAVLPVLCTAAKLLGSQDVVSQVAASAGDVSLVSSDSQPAADSAMDTLNTSNADEGMLGGAIELPWPRDEGSSQGLVLVTPPYPYSSVYPSR